MVLESVAGLEVQTETLETVAEFAPSLPENPTEPLGEAQALAPAVLEPVAELGASAQTPVEVVAEPVPEPAEPLETVSVFAPSPPEPWSETDAQALAPATEPTHGSRSRRGRAEAAPLATDAVWPAAGVELVSEPAPEPVAPSQTAKAAAEVALPPEPVIEVGVADSTPFVLAPKVGPEASPETTLEVVPEVASSAPDRQIGAEALAFGSADAPLPTEPARRARTRRGRPSEVTPAADAPNQSAQDDGFVLDLAAEPEASAETLEALAELGAPPPEPTTEGPAPAVELEASAETPAVEAVSELEAPAETLEGVAEVEPSPREAEVLAPAAAPAATEPVKRSRSRRERVAEDASAVAAAEMVPEADSAPASEPEAAEMPVAEAPEPRAASAETLAVFAELELSQPELLTGDTLATVDAPVAAAPGKRSRSRRVDADTAEAPAPAGPPQNVVVVAEPTDQLAEPTWAIDAVVEVGQSPTDGAAPAPTEAPDLSEPARRSRSRRGRLTEVTLTAPTADLSEPTPGIEGVSEPVAGPATTEYPAAELAASALEPRARPWPWRPRTRRPPSRRLWPSRPGARDRGSV